MVQRVVIKDDLILWAIEESQLPFDEIKAKFPSVESWIDHSKDPTFLQLKSFADYLHIPFGYFFLDESPKKELLYAEFRAIANKKPTMSKNLEDTLSEMTIKQNWMREYREDQGYEPFKFVGNFRHKNSAEIKEFIYKALVIEDYWSENEKNLDEAYSSLKRRIEELGVLIMQSGIVGANTHRKLDIHEFRGFVLLDPYAPLVFVNTNDSKAGMIFTLIHEFIHLLMGDEDILDIDEESLGYIDAERRVNRITSMILIPDEILLGYKFTNDDVYTEITEIAKKLKVSSLSVAIKLKEMGTITQSQLEEVKRTSIENFEKSLRKGNKGGPDFFTVLNSKLSPSFSEAVISQTLAGEIPFTEAYGLLGVKGKTFDKFANTFFNYG